MATNCRIANTGARQVRKGMRAACQWEWRGKLEKTWIIKVIQIQFLKKVDGERTFLRICFTSQHLVVAPEWSTEKSLSPRLQLSWWTVTGAQLSPRHRLPENIPSESEDPGLSSFRTLSSPFEKTYFLSYHPFEAWRLSFTNWSTVSYDPPDTRNFLEGKSAGSYSSSDNSHGSFLRKWSFWKWFLSGPSPWKQRQNLLLHPQ